MVKLHRGYTLLGMLITISLSSLLFWVISQFYINTQTQNNRIFLQLYLQHSLERALQTVTKDIKRSGFISLSNKVSQDNFLFFINHQNNKSLVIHQKNGEKEGSCILFFYDLDKSGCIGGRALSNKRCIKNNRNNTLDIQKELFGYRLNKGHLETRILQKKQVNTHCTKLNCSLYLSSQQCNLAGWHKLIHSNDIKISQLRFHWLRINELLEIQITGYLTKQKKITYETRAVVPLLNKRG